MLIVHPGGPFWAKKDKAAWSVPKGEFVDGEESLAAAKREFREELGLDLPAGDPQPLDEAKQPSGKVVHVWALQADLDIARIQSNQFSMEWPPKSGKQQDFPEVDKAKWCSLPEAAEKLVKGQVVFLERLVELLKPQLPNLTLEKPAEPTAPAQASLF